MLTKWVFKTSLPYILLKFTISLVLLPGWKGYVGVQLLQPEPLVPAQRGQEGEERIHMFPQVGGLEHGHVPRPVVGGPSLPAGQLHLHQAHVLKVAGGGEALTAHQRSGKGGRPSICQLRWATVFLRLAVIQPLYSVLGSRQHIFPIEVTSRQQKFRPDMIVFNRGQYQNLKNKDATVRKEEKPIQIGGFQRVSRRRELC